MKTFRRLFIAIVALAIVVSLSSCGKKPGKVLLRYHLKKGSIYQLTMRTSQNILQDAMGSKQSVKQSMGFTYTYHIKDVTPKGLITIDSQFKRITFKMDMQGRTIEYDSANPSDNIPPAAVGLAALVGKGYTIKMDGSGRVQKIEGAGQLVNAMMPLLNTLPADKRAGLAKSLKEQFGESALKESTERMTDIFPHKPIGIDGSWRRSITLTKGFPMKTDTIWTLKDRRDGISFIETRATIKPNKDMPFMKMGQLRIGAIYGRGSGTIKIDEKSGFMVESQFKQHFSGTVVMVSPTLPKPLTWPLTVDGTSTIECKKI